MFKLSHNPSWNNNESDKFFEALARQLLKAGGSEKLIPIVEMGSPILRHETAAYDGQLNQRTLTTLSAAMRVTMLDAPGVGLAGPQIGLPLAIAVVEDHVRSFDEDDDPELFDTDAMDAADADGGYDEEFVDPDEYFGDDIDPDAPDPREIAEFPFHAIINPRYEPVGDATASFYEGCLSMPGFQAVRRRFLDITAFWQDEMGKQHEERLHGWPARIFQHETDHLSGEVYIDKAEIRSLSTDKNLEELWSFNPIPKRAGKELGFEVN
jgi:peptide deformylase